MMCIFILFFVVTFVLVVEWSLFWRLSLNHMCFLFPEILNIMLFHIFIIWIFMGYFISSFLFSWFAIDSCVPDGITLLLTKPFLFFVAINEIILVVLIHRVLKILSLHPPTIFTSDISRQNFNCIKALCWRSMCHFVLIRINHNFNWICWCQSRCFVEWIQSLIYFILILVVNHCLIFFLICVGFIQDLLALAATTNQTVQV